ncbi:unnamed protein product [Cunninghamella blakesleeana]
MRLFITIGSTSFNELVDSATSLQFLEEATSQGITHLTIQYGTSKETYLKNIKEYQGNMMIDGYDYKPSIDHDMASADIIICHSGSGTILQGLRLHKKLIVVVNETLMNNHQAEIAQVMAMENYVIYGDYRDLSFHLSQVSKHELKPYPPPNPSLFANILDKKMGFI